MKQYELRKMVHLLAQEINKKFIRLEDGEIRLYGVNDMCPKNSEEMELMEDWNEPI